MRARGRAWCSDVRGGGALNAGCGPRENGNPRVSEIPKNLSLSGMFNLGLYLGLFFGGLVSFFGFVILFFMCMGCNWVFGLGLGSPGKIWVSQYKCINYICY
ncbi:hypothetical protein ES332_A08G030100v1 [Gossypium tomentosum]|uniref:Transmembrane protein n=1 Tax=Gossypium tomentosum TaxID=34277 RepID=A0A5D2PCH6_GOSTO|nr:hypothetical protein ES332_A08G030100v1 [Gossypium tomentosum]